MHDTRINKSINRIKREYAVEQGIKEVEQVQEKSSIDFGLHHKAIHAAVEQ